MPMETSRRAFIRKMGLPGTGLVAMNLSEILSASDSMEPTKDYNKNKGLTFLFQGDSITDGNRTRVRTF